MRPGLANHRLQNADRQVRLADADADHETAGRCRRRETRRRTPWPCCQRRRAASPCRARRSRARRAQTAAGCAPRRAADRPARRASSRSARRARRHRPRWTSSACRCRSGRTSVVGARLPRLRSSSDSCASDFRRRSFCIARDSIWRMRSRDRRRRSPICCSVHGFAAVQAVAQPHHLALLGIELGHRGLELLHQRVAREIVVDLVHAVDRPACRPARRRRRSPPRIRTRSFSDTSSSGGASSLARRLRRSPARSAISCVVGACSSCACSAATCRRSAPPRRRLWRQRVHASGLRQQMHDRLPDPPHGVGDELDVALGIEAARAFDQPEIAFVNQIEKRHAEVAIALGVRDDEAQVRLARASARASSSDELLDAAAELALLVDRQAGELRDLAQIRLQRRRIRRERFDPAHARDT